MHDEVVDVDDENINKEITTEDAIDVYEENIEITTSQLEKETQETDEVIELDRSAVIEMPGDGEPTQIEEQQMESSAFVNESPAERLDATHAEDIEISSRQIEAARRAG